MLLICHPKTKATGITPAIILVSEYDTISLKIPKGIDQEKKKLLELCKR